MKHFKKRPSPAMIVAVTALFISLVGTAFAGPIAEISLNRGEKKQIRKITRKVSNRVANRRITKRAPSLAVGRAQSANIANLAALANTVANDAITTEKIKDAGVTTDDLADAAVTLAKLADDSVDSAKVVDNSLGSADLGPNSVTTSEILNNSVTNPKIGFSAVSSSKIGTGQVRASDLGSIIQVENVESIAGNTNGSSDVSCPVGTQVISGGGFTGSFTNMYLVTSIRLGNGWRVQSRNETGGALNLTARAYCLQA